MADECIYINSMIKYYAGIGSRTCPPGMHRIMGIVAEELARAGWVLRSGGAEGADTAFEGGCDFARGNKEIFLPWRRFNGNTSTLYNPPDWAYQVAYENHPSPSLLKAKPTIGKLMARNSCQVLGPTGDVYSLFVVCYTPDGVENYDPTTKRTGGTGQAIRIATRYEIPIFNLNKPDALDRLSDALNMEFNV